MLRGALPELLLKLRREDLTGLTLADLNEDFLDDALGGLRETLLRGGEAVALLLRSRAERDLPGGGLLSPMLLWGLLLTLLSLLLPPRTGVLPLLLPDNFCGLLLALELLLCFASMPGLLPPLMGLMFALLLRTLLGLILRLLDLLGRLSTTSGRLSALPSDSILAPTLLLR